MEQAKQALHYYTHFLENKMKENQKDPISSHIQSWKNMIDKTQRVLRLKHRSIHTEKSYLNWIKKFAGFNRFKPLDKISGNDIRKFLGSLAVKNHVSSSIQN